MDTYSDHDEQSVCQVMVVCSYRKVWCDSWALFYTYYLLQSIWNNLQLYLGFFLLNILAILYLWCHVMIFWGRIAIQIWITIFSVLIKCLWVTSFLLVFSGFERFCFVWWRFSCWYPIRNSAFLHLHHFWLTLQYWLYIDEVNAAWYLPVHVAAVFQIIVAYFILLEFYNESKIVSLIA